MAKKTTAEFKPIFEFAKAADLPGWKVLAMCRASGWTSDKMVTEDEFNKALNSFENKAMGGVHVS